MTYTILPVTIANGDTFLDLIYKANTIIDVLAFKTVTVDSNTAVGHAGIEGSLSSNTVYVSEIFGGRRLATGPLTVSSNTSFINVAFSGVNTYFSAIGNVHIPGANATHRAVFANNTTSKLYYGNLRTEIMAIDGAGSLIDSDFLDGQDGDWYSDIPARQGYVSVNKAGDTITGLFSVTGNTTVVNTSFTGVNTSFAAITNIHIPGSNTTNRLPMANTTSSKLYYADLRNEITLIDGAGSLIDSDFLDGQQGAWYSDIPARQGYVSVNKAGDTVTGVFSVTGNTSIVNVAFSGVNTYFSAIGNVHIPGANTTHRTVMTNAATNKLYYADLRNEITLIDGAGSLIDSDFLDGQDGTWYADIPARQGYTSVNKAGDTLAGIFTFNGQVNVLNVAFSGVNTYFAAAGNLHIPGANVTHRTLLANNTTNKLYYASLKDEIVAIDGAGSLIDSDLLDGQQGAWYSDIPGRQGYTSVNKAGDTVTGVFTFSGQTNLVNVAFSGVNTYFSAIGNVHIPGANATHKVAMANTTTNKLYYANLKDEIVAIDGTGSLIDSDLLDGQHGTYYADIPARQGYTSVNKAGDTVTGALTINGATSANTLSVTSTATVGGALTLQGTVLSANTSITKIANTPAIEFNNLVLSSNTAVVSTTTPTVIHQFTKSGFNTVKYVVSILNSTDSTLMATEILVLSDNFANTAHSTQYATISSNNVFGEFTVTNTITDTQLIFTSSAIKTLVFNYTATMMK